MAFGKHEGSAPETLDPQTTVGLRIDGEQRARLRCGLFDPAHDRQGVPVRIAEHRARPKRAPGELERIQVAFVIAEIGAQAASVDDVLEPAHPLGESRKRPAMIGLRRLV